MDFDLRLVRYFVVVADELHFGRAAAKLYISQPALSKQIRKLEGVVGEPLLIRDSRHVRLTERGQRFLEDSRQLLTIAERMSHAPNVNVVRIAHIFELTTSRDVADAFVAVRPDIQVVERSMDSIRQLDALLSDQLDVAILRVTRQMVADHPAGWHYRLLRLEPMVLVGRPGDPHQDSASFHDRAIEVFADTPGSGMYNVHGEFLTAFERDTGIALRWLGNPGTFNNCIAAVLRAREPAFCAGVPQLRPALRRGRPAGLPPVRASTRLSLVRRLAGRATVGAGRRVRPDGSRTLPPERLDLRDSRAGPDVATTRRSRDQHPDAHHAAGTGPLSWPAS